MIQSPEISDPLRLVVNLLMSEGATEVYLFGSAAKRDLRPESDYDIAVAGIRPEEFFRVYGKAISISDRPIDLILLDGRDPFAEFLRSHGRLQRVA